MNQGTAILTLEEKKNRVNVAWRRKYVRHWLIFVCRLSPTYAVGEATKLGLEGKADLPVSSFGGTHVRNFYQAASDVLSKKKTP